MLSICGIISPLLLSKRQDSTVTAPCWGRHNAINKGLIRPYWDWLIQTTFPENMVTSYGLRTMSLGWPGNALGSPRRARQCSRGEVQVFVCGGWRRCVKSHLVSRSELSPGFISSPVVVLGFCCFHVLVETQDLPLLEFSHSGSLR